MTNNLKAERTLTAVTDERLKSLIAHEGRVVGAYELRSIMLELQHLRSQSLSTQQPMGEVKNRLMALDRFSQFVDGWGDEVLGLKQHQAGDYIKWSDLLHVIQSLSAIHPNQESGE